MPEDKFGCFLLGCLVTGLLLVVLVLSSYVGWEYHRVKDAFGRQHIIYSRGEWEDVQNVFSSVVRTNIKDSLNADEKFARQKEIEEALDQLKKRTVTQ